MVRMHSEGTTLGEEENSVDVIRLTRTRANVQIEVSIEFMLCRMQMCLASMNALVNFDHVVVELYIYFLEINSAMVCVHWFPLLNTFNFTYPATSSGR